MLYSGTIIEIDQNKTYVFTLEYSVVAIKTRKEYFPKQLVTFTKKDIYIDFYRRCSYILKVISIPVAVTAVFTLLLYFLYY